VKRLLAKISLHDRTDADIFIEKYKAHNGQLTNQIQDGRKVLTRLKNELENLICK
jgi:hypothetical protein